MHVFSELASFDGSSLFSCIMSVLSKVVTIEQSAGCERVMVASDLYQPLWESSRGVYCNSLSGKSFPKNYCCTINLPPK